MSGSGGGEVEEVGSGVGLGGWGVGVGGVGRGYGESVFNGTRVSVWEMKDGESCTAM